MSLCERLSGRRMEKSYPPPSHVELGLESPRAALGKYNSDIIERTLTFFQNIYCSVLFAKCVLSYCYELRLKT